MPSVRRSSVSAQFGASHQLEGDPVCGRVHGHQYTVKAYWDLMENPEAVGSIIKVVREFASMHLNDMIPAAPATVEGLAGYLSERLAIAGVTRVEVYESDTGRGAEVERLPS